MRKTGSKIGYLPWGRGHQLVMPCRVVNHKNKVTLHRLSRFYLENTCVDLCKCPCNNSKREIKNLKESNEVDARVCRQEMEERNVVIILQFPPIRIMIIRSLITLPDVITLNKIYLWDFPTNFCYACDIYEAFDSFLLVCRNPSPSNESVKKEHWAIWLAIG